MDINFNWPFVTIIAILVIGLKIIPLANLKWLENVIFKLFNKKK